VLKRPLPAILALIASGYTPVYPCHVPARDMPQHPIRAGPFEIVEFKLNESIRLARNPDYWKPGRPYLDGIEYTTAILAFTAAKFDLTFPYEVTVPLKKDVKSQAPEAICELVPSNAAPSCWSTARRRPLTIPTCASRSPWRSTQELYRHSCRRAVRHRRGDAAAAGRGLGHAIRYSGDDSRL
jgi:hypothetical protein